MSDKKPIIRRRRGKRMKEIERMNLSEHTLKINDRRCNYDKFRFSEIEDYVRALTAGREYQFEAIREVMIYLWGGSYKTIEDLAMENWSLKPQIRDRFGSEEIMMGHLPLRDRLSGVVHMATGTGKSFVIFAVAHLSVLLGLTKRVLVLGPSSTIIEQGLTDKFKDLMRDPKLNALLPREYQNRAINLLTDNDAIEDDSIVIENINAVFTFGGIQDTLFRGNDEILVLSDEVHHAYSHLKFNATSNTVEEEFVAENAKVTDDNAERLWMQFLLGKGRYKKPEYFQSNGKHKITRHIGFTGTPYNGDDYFADVLFDYSIKTATEEKYIKEINPLLKTSDAEGDAIQWTDEKRFAVVLKNHLDNKAKYSYVRKGKMLVKPITMFICPNQANAKKATANFIKFLSKWEVSENGASSSASEIEQMVSERVICVVSSISESEFKPQLDNIEETNPDKIGGKVEFIFAVNKLSEGWDVDNVFQIVPMEERVFNSKLLISQVLGRGLRIPRKINVHGLSIGELYPRLTVTNHEKFASHIEELMDSVIQSDMHIASEPLTPSNQTMDLDRAKNHFCLFNLSYIATPVMKDVEAGELSLPAKRKLILSKQDLSEPVKIEFLKDTKQYVFKKKTVSVDGVILDLHRRFKGREYEGIHFDFGQGEQARCPKEVEIRKTILSAMKQTNIVGNQLSEENKQQIDLYFNQFLPKGTKKRVFENVLGDIIPIPTESIERSTVRLGDLERDATVFVSENYEAELDTKTKAVFKHLIEARTKSDEEKKQRTLFTIDPQDFLGSHSDYTRPLVDKDPRPPYIVNPSVLKSPQSAVLVSHSPEKEFIFLLLKNSTFFKSWVKSSDRGFYSLDYKFWKGGKTEVTRSFNPDFFIVQNLSEYIAKVRNLADSKSLAFLRELQEEGIDELVRVVEIKSDEDEDETIVPKEESAKAHFNALNSKLRDIDQMRVSAKFRSHLKQHYIFDLLRPEGYWAWIESLKKGNVM